MDYNYINKELIFLLSIIRNYVVSLRRDFIFLLVLGMGCLILLRHSQGHFDVDSIKTEKATMESSLPPL